MSGSSAGASPEPVRRFEVFTGEDRRRTWALADKMALVAEMAATDNISELARCHAGAAAVRGQAAEAGCIPISSASPAIVRDGASLHH